MATIDDIIHKGALTLVNMMDYCKATDDPILFSYYYLLLGIVPYHIHKVPEFFTKPGLEHLRLSLHMQIINLLTQFINSVQLLFTCKSYIHYSCLL